MKRLSGVLLHISSLPSSYGIGTLGKEAYRFIDFLKKAGQTYWQILPAGPVGAGGSPYQSCSAFAGNPYFVDLDLLVSERLLQTEECPAWGGDPASVDFDFLAESRIQSLRKAFSRFDAENADFRAFLHHEQYWLDDYSLYMALKDHFEGTSWNEWEFSVRMCDENALAQWNAKLEKEIIFWQFVQYKFFSQWNALKAYAGQKGIKIIGDIPIYVAYDSADVWSNQCLFDLESDGTPRAVSGCPPDAFSRTGQLWNNPLYLWEFHKNTGFSWWMERLRAASKQYDLLRIDHFRGFDQYYAIPYGALTAENGVWRDGPGIEFFRVLSDTLPGFQLIAEDLGTLTESVCRLLEETGYPGMKVLQFAFSAFDESSYLPHNHIRNCVVYTGTHDNNTILGWFRSLSDADRRFCMEYLRMDEDTEIHDAMMTAAFSSVADTAIIQMQDLLKLDESGRMNTPSTVGTNWKWRMLPEALNDANAEYLLCKAKCYARVCR